MAKRNSTKKKEKERKKFVVHSWPARVQTMYGKTNIYKIYFVELCDDLILLGIPKFP